MELSEPVPKANLFGKRFRFEFCKTLLDELGFKPPKDPQGFHQSRGQNEKCAKQGDTIENSPLQSCYSVLGSLETLNQYSSIV